MKLMIIIGLNITILMIIFVLTMFLLYLIAARYVNYNNMKLIHAIDATSNISSSFYEMMVHRKEEENAFFLGPSFDNQQKVLVFFSYSIDTGDFKLANSDNDKLQALINALSLHTGLGLFKSFSPEKNKLCGLNKKSKIHKDLEFPPLFRFFSSIGLFKGSLYYAYRRIFDMLEKAWKDIEKIRFIFIVEEEDSVIFGLANSENNTLIDYESFSNIEFKGRTERVIIIHPINLFFSCLSLVDVPPHVIQMNEDLRKIKTK